MIDKWKIMYLPKMQGCEDQYRPGPIGLKDVQGLFYMYAAFLCLSLLGFVMEKWLVKNYKTMMLKVKTMFTKNTSIY